MAVDTKAVQGRRSLSFASLDEVVADAERLVASPHVTMLGNLSLGQILAHLAVPVNGAIDGIDRKAPWFIRLLGPWFKSRILSKGMPPGFKLPKGVEAEMFPAVDSAEQGLAILREAVARLKTERMNASHPILGKLSHDEWSRLHRRHAELHLSYAVPRG